MENECLHQTNIKNCIWLHPIESHCIESHQIVPYLKCTVPESYRSPWIYMHIELSYEEEMHTPTRHHLRPLGIVQPLKYFSGLDQFFIFCHERLTMNDNRDFLQCISRGMVLGMSVSLYPEPETFFCLHNFLEPNRFNSLLKVMHREFCAQI